MTDRGMARGRGALQGALRQGMMNDRRHSTRIPLVLAAILALLACTPGISAAQALPCGIVLMHGKWGLPQSPFLRPVVEKLQPHCRVLLPEMPWSRNRLYDRPYADAIEQIREAVASLRQSGAQWIAVGGQSFGANAALAYMAQAGDADALLPMAPGHVPETFYLNPEVRPGVDTARRLVESGRGSTLVEMTDINQGQRRSVRAPAAALWSYFDPQGWGNMTLSAEQSRKAVPVFWAIGTLDPLHGSPSMALYGSLPQHPESRHLVVRADHATTPGAAADELLKWVLARIQR